MVSDLKIVFRQIRRNAYFSILKVLGLCIGFTVFVLMLVQVRKELSYDDFWSNKEKLFRVGLERYQEGELQIRSAKNYRGMSDLLVQEFPEVLNRVRISKDIITLFAGEDHQIQDVDMFYCDTTLFSVFPLNMVDAESAFPFADIHATIISESLALALFGTADAVGMELKLNEGWKFYVSAVYEDIPANSHLKADMFLHWESLYYYLQNYNVPARQLIENPDFSYTEPGPNHARSWGNRLTYNYIIIREDADVAALQEKASELLKTWDLPEYLHDTKIIPIIQAVHDIHLHSDFPDEIRANSSMYRVYMLLLIGFIVLVVSWINFVNLFAIEFHERSGEIAVRVINGAGSRQIIGLIWQKGFLLSAISGVFAVLLIYLISMWAGWLNALDLAIFLYVLVLIILSTLISIIIPVTGYTSGNTMDHLKGKVLGKMKGRNYRRVLVLLQFISSIVLISCTIIIYLQMEYTRKKNLGFNPEKIIYSFSPMTMNMNPEIPSKLIQFKNSLHNDPGITDFTVSSSIPGKPIAYPGFSAYRSTGAVEKEFFLYRINMDPGYLDTYEIAILAGEGFRDDHNYQVENVIINRRASELLGFSEPAEALGELVRVGALHYSIVGVTEDYHHLSLKSELLPIIFFKSLSWRLAVGYYSFKLTGYDPELIQRIGKKWTEIYPGEQFIFSSMEAGYLEQYAADRTFGNSFMLAAILAILVSCLGLLGLSKFNALRRTREIGIRKTFGASESSILFLLQAETLVLIMISTAAGIPVARWIIARWLESFVFHIHPVWWMFFAAFLLTLMVAILSVSILSIRTARANPVDSIRYE